MPNPGSEQKEWGKVMVAHKDHQPTDTTWNLRVCWDSVFRIPNLRRRSGQVVPNKSTGIPQEITEIEDWTIFVLVRWNRSKSSDGWKVNGSEHWIGLLALGKCTRGCIILGLYDQVTSQDTDISDSGWNMPLWRTTFVFSSSTSNLIWPPISIWIQKWAKPPLRPTFLSHNHLRVHLHWTTHTNYPISPMEKV